MRSQAILGGLLAILAEGCTSTGQRYIERLYSDPDANGDQWVVSEQIVKNRTIAPPFGSKADSTHQFEAVVNEDGSYTLRMGSQGTIEGGEIATAMLAAAEALRAAAAAIAEVKSPIPLEPLISP